MWKEFHVEQVDQFLVNLVEFLEVIVIELAQQTSND